MTVDLHRWTCRRIGHGPNPGGPRRKGKKVGHDHARLLGEFAHGRRAMTLTSEVKHVAESLFFESMMQVNDGIENDVVVAKGSVRVPFVKSVIDEERSAVVVGHPATHVNHGVFVNTEERLQPNHDRAFAHRCTLIGQPTAAFTEVFRQLHGPRGIFR